MRQAVSRWTNRWSWASHMTCLLLGFGLANIMGESREEPLRLGRQSVALALSGLSPQVLASGPLARGDQVHLVRRHAGTGEVICRLGRAGGRLLQLQPKPIVVLTQEEAWEVLSSLRISSVEERNVVAPMNRTLALAVRECRTEPRVEYGGEG